MVTLWLHVCLKTKLPLIWILWAEKTARQNVLKFWGRLITPRNFFWFVEMFGIDVKAKENHNQNSCTRIICPFEIDNNNVKLSCDFFGPSPEVYAYMNCWAVEVQKSKWFTKKLKINMICKRNWNLLSCEKWNETTKNFLHCLLELRTFTLVNK